MWLDPRARVRVIVTAGAVSELRIQPYLPAGVIVAPRGQPLGIETVRPFVDATADELRAAYPAQLRSAARDRVVLAWPPDDLGETFEVELGLEQGRVRRMQYRLHHGGNPAARQRLLELLEARYGAAKAIAGGRRQLRESPSVTVTEAEDAWWVDVAAVAPP